jgi:hypothetical protein
MEGLMVKNGGAPHVEQAHVGGTHVGETHRGYFMVKRLIGLASNGVEDTR